MCYRVRFADGVEVLDLEIVPALKLCDDRYPDCVFEEIGGGLWLLVFACEDDSCGSLAEKLAHAVGEIIPGESRN